MASSKIAEAYNTVFYSSVNSAMVESWTEDKLSNLAFSASKLALHKANES